MNEANLLELLLQAIEERVERAAYRGCLRAQQEVVVADEIGSEDAARILGRVRADGTPNMPALKAFMHRHVVPHRKVGRKLVFSRRELAVWSTERQARRRR